MSTLLKEPQTTLYAFKTPPFITLRRSERTLVSSAGVSTGVTTGVTATGSDGTTAYNVEFGVNQEFAYVTTLANAAPTLSANVLIAPYNAGVIQTTSPTIDTTLTTTKFVGVAISILYRSFGYKQAPQNVIDGFDVKVTYSDYPEENHYGFVTTDGDVYVKTTINFYELPSDENLLKTSNSADVNSWLPFNWRGVNY